MSIEIIQAKIIKGKKESKTLFVSYLRTESDKSKTECQEDFNARVHEDLINSFSKLDIYFGLITECVELKKVKNVYDFDSGLIEKLHVSSFKIGGNEESPGVTLTGHKILSTGKALIMNAPFTLLESDDESGFKYAEELDSALNEVKAEVRAYMEGKHAPDPQLEMFESATVVDEKGTLKNDSE